MHSGKHHVTFDLTDNVASVIFGCMFGLNMYTVKTFSSRPAIANLSLGIDKLLIGPAKFPIIHHMQLLD